jgi:3',5'-cyclic AMP phosphodiesterase CpdA
MKSFEFLFMADCQLGAYATLSGMDDDDIEGFAERGMVVRKAPKTDGIEWDVGRYEEAIATANRLRPVFAVMGGDMLDDLTDRGQLLALRKVTATLDTDISMYWAPGNHDVAYDAVEPTYESVQEYRSIFGQDYYRFVHEDTSLVVLNTTVLGTPTQLPEEAERQMEALGEHLRAAANESERTILIGHHPLFVDHADEEDTYWNVPKVVRLPVIDLARTYGVKTVFSGHLHRNNRAEDAGLEVIASGPVGYPLGHDPSGYRVVTVSEDGVSHRYASLKDGDSPDF